MTVKRTAILLILLLMAAGCGPKVVEDEPAEPMDHGRLMFEEGQFDASRAWFEARLDENPDDVEAHHYLGRIAIREKLFDDAIQHFQRNTALDADSSDAYYWLAIGYVNKLQNTQDFMQMGEIAPKVKSNVEKAVELNPDNIEARIFLAQYLLNAPPIAGGDAARGMREVEEIKARDPKAGHLLQAELHMREKNVDDALASLRTALDADPDDSEVYYRMGRVYQDAERYDEAFNAFEGALEHEPDHMNALYQIGRTAVFAERNVERGIACLARFLEMEPGEGEPSHANAQWRLGMLWELKGEKENAAAAYRAALELDPEYEEARESLDALEGD